MNVLVDESDFVLVLFLFGEVGVLFDEEQVDFVEDIQVLVAGL